MIKTASAAIACVALAAPAVAGPYALIENNAGWAGSDFGGSATDFHLGYEGANKEGTASYYIQGGPTYLQPNGGTGDTVLSGKVGGSVKLAEPVSLYGELSAAFDNVNAYGSKIGVKYSF